MWHPIEKAPVDEFVLLADSGGYVSQAIYGEDEENPRWRLASGEYLHANFKPLAWMPMPEYLGSISILPERQMAKKLNISEPPKRNLGPILVRDGRHVVAEFVHNECENVPQSYEMAISFARHFVDIGASMDEAVRALIGSINVDEACIVAIEPFIDPMREVSRDNTGVPTVHIEVFMSEVDRLRNFGRWKG